jgi:hypothetical protein
MAERVGQKREFELRVEAFHGAGELEQRPRLNSSTAGLSGRSQTFAPREATLAPARP